MRVIKRYSNRRLYDTETSRTITQKDLAELVQTGADIKVVESATGKDITMTVLGRTLVQQADSWKDLKESKELFRGIIAAGGDKSMSILKNTVLASIGAFEVTKAKAEQIVDDLIKKGELNRSDRKKAVMEMLEKTEKSTAKWKDKVVAESSKVQASVSKAVNDLKLVKQADLAKIEKKLDKLTKAINDLNKKVEQ